MDNMNLEIYEGKEPYIFVSYCHEDMKRIYPVISYLINNGYRVWYDKGINPGYEWPEVIADHLSRCSVSIIFISEKSLQSHNCRREFNYAIMEDKKMIVIILEEVQFTPVMKMQMATVQALYYEESDDFQKKVDNSGILEICRCEDKGKNIKVKNYYLKRKYVDDEIMITKDEFRIGRRRELCDYFVDNNKTVSGIHAIIYKKDGYCQISNCSSTNGTYINDEKIENGIRVILRDGDLIEMGSEKFIFLER